MRLFTGTLSILSITIATDIGLNLPCNKELDGLLATDPDGSSNTFLSCKGLGMGNVGFWERKVCPNDMIFDFINQQCRTQKKKSRNPPTWNIAILNNSCANNEICIGGTVCDINSFKCLCPYGTIPQIDTLSCIKTESSFINTDIQPFSFNSFSSLEKPSIPGGQISGMPQPSQVPNFFQSNNFKFSNQFGPSTSVNSFGGADNFDVKSNNYGVKNNFGGTSNNGDHSNSPDTSKWNFNMLPTHSMSTESNSASNSFGIDFKPNPNSQQNFIFRPNVNSFQPTEIKITTPHQKKLPVLAHPGLSCRNNEVCIGGSICTLPMALCLCPGDLEERDGECVLPVSSSIKKTKVGALCSDLTECEYGSTCVNGRCTCLSPLVQSDGKCILKQERKEVGPGELCDNGEICIKGSVCDSVIPVCVCPPQTDLNDGKCVKIIATTKTSLNNSGMTFSWIPDRASSISTIHTPPTTQAFIQSTVTKMPTEANKASFIQTVPTVSSVKSVFKTNHIKNALGGTKQGGVGVLCSLNTDCMIGAYCNGNTNPPSCQCLSTHVSIEKRCQKIVYPGQIGCRSDLQCSAAYRGTTCIDRICVCSEGLKAVDQTCVPEFADSNERCGFLPTKHNQPECQGGSVCHNGQCICPAPLILSPDKTCIPPNPSSVDSSLNECDPACDFPQVCINNHCTCLDVVLCSSKQLTRSRRQSVEKSMICWPGAEKCSDGNGICIEGVCHCINGLIVVDGLCRPEFIPLKGYCSPHVNSPRCEDNAICVNGVCTCKLSGGCMDNNVIFSSRTRYQNERCFSDTQCQPGAQCIEGRCQCYEETMKNGICSSSLGAFKNINSPCSSNDRCSSGSVCRDHVCQCVDDSKEQHGRCHQVPGGRCSHGQTCDGGSVCEFGVCRCPESHIINAGQCLLALSEPGQSCQLGQKCIHASVCRFGLCMCIAKFFAIKGRCVKRENIVAVRPKNVGIIVKPGNIRSPGTQCFEKDICSGGSHCQEGFCICNDLEVIINNQCVGSHSRANEIINELLIAAPGQSCEARTNCTGGSTCIDRICKCENGKIDASGICSDYQKYGYPVAEKIPKIKPDLVPGSTCTLTLQCPYRTECVKGVCRCKRGETIVNNTCRSAIHGVLPGGKCDPRKGYDCIAESRCYYGVCTCLRHLVNNGNECITSTEIGMVPPGKQCSFGQICSGGARCIEQMCRCNIDEVLDVNKKCVKKYSVYPLFNKYPEFNASVLSLESPADGQTTQSQLPGLGEYCSMNCREGKCINNQCVQLHKENNKSQGQINIEELEMENKNNPIHSFSNTNVNPTIVESTISGYLCYKNEDCPTNSFCFERLCRCMNGFRSTAGYCEPIVKAGEECISTNQCEGNAFCIDGRCSCQTLDGRTCSEPILSHPGEDCIQRQICSYNSYCGLLSGVCECPRGMATVDGRCQLTSTESGMACITSKNCHKSSYCDNGFCLCKTGFILVNNFCLPPGTSITNEGSREEEFDDKFIKQSDKNGETDLLYQKSIVNEPLTYSNIPVANNLGAAQPTNFDTLQTSNFVSPMMRPMENPQDLTKPSFNYPANSNIQTVMEGVNVPVPTPTMESSPSFYPFTPLFLSNHYLQSGKLSIPFAKGVNTKLGEGLINNVGKNNQKLKIVMPGEYCGDGSICLGNSVCKAEFCRCPNKSFVENGVCVTRKILNPTRTEQNDIEKSDQEEETKEERQFAAPLENCQNFEFCTGGSECLNIRGIGLVCQCPHNKIFLDNECVDVPKKAILVGIGDKCGSGEVCLGGSTCSHDICVCEDGKKDILGICLITAKAGDSCSGGEICIDGSLCTSSLRTCVCPPGKLSRLGQCIDSDTSMEYRYSSKPGEFCNIHAICTDNSFCNGRGICQCLPKFENLDGRCLPTNMISHPGDVCFPSTICSASSECQEGFCVCPKGKLLLNNHCVRITNQVRYRETKTLGCHNDTDCPFNYRCAGSICVCHGISSECLAMMHIEADFQCVFDQQCPKNTMCIENQCICNEGFKMVDGMCIRRRIASVPVLRPAALNDSSMKSNESSLPPFNAPMKSPDHLAIKSSAFNAKNDANYSKAFKEWFGVNHTNSTLNYFQKSYYVSNESKPGASCLAERTCVNGSICFEGYCVCGFEDIVENDQCIPRDNNIRVGEWCSDVYRCKKGLLCVAGRCSCDINDQNCKANETVTSPPGGSCSDARECVGGSACHEGWCICPDPTMIVQKGICIQPGPRPTVPPKTVPVYTTTTPTMYIYQTFVPATHTASPTFLQSNHQPAQVQENYLEIKQFNTLTTASGRKAAPGSHCGPLDICVGDSMCVDGLCVCPVGSQPSQHSRCEKSLPPPASTLASGSVHMGKFTHHRTQLFGSSSHVLSTPDYIELPTHAPLTTANTHLESDECMALGLFCRGNTVCRNRSCQCPEGYVLHNDACVLPHDMETRKVRGRTRHQVNESTAYSRPGDRCGNKQICTGGSDCGSDGFCVCPPNKSVNGELCSSDEESKKYQAGPGESCDHKTVCIKGSSCHSGQCRCQPGFIALSGNCVSLPMPTTPQMKTVAFAKPLESCDNGEQCEGGASCDQTTGICMCPPGQIVFGIQCQIPSINKQRTTRNTPSPSISKVDVTQTQLAITTAPDKSTMECVSDSNCADGKTCVGSRCKCRPGYVDNAGQCEPLEEIELGERPVPISYAKHKVETMISEKNQSSPIPMQNEDHTNPVSTFQTPLVQATQRPRIVGPPIRRPKLKSKIGPGNSGSGNYKTGSGNGTCPPGNDPTRDDSGKLIMCNGLEPNCPPRSYCYITSGGFATEEYNCCKSW